MTKNRYINGFLYASSISGLLILVFFLFGIPNEDTSSWLVMKPHLGTSITKKIVSSFLSCFFHGDSNHLLGNVFSFLIFGTYMFSVSRIYSFAALFAGMILPGFLLYFLPYQDNGIYFGFSGVCFTAIGFSLVSFLRTDFEIKSDWLPAIILAKLLFTIFILNNFLGAGFWGTLYNSEISKGIAWQIHLIGLITGLTFAISDKENSWHFLFGNSITDEEKNKIKSYFQSFKDDFKKNQEN